MNATNIQQTSCPDKLKSWSGCLICYSETQISDLIDSFTDTGEDIVFILNNLLRIPKDIFSSRRTCEEGGERKLLRSLSVQEIRLCCSCRMEVGRAKGLVDQLIKELRELRAIQRNFVDLVRKGSGGSTADNFGGKGIGGVETLADKCRQFVVKHHRDENFVVGKDLLSLELETCGTTYLSENYVWEVKEEADIVENNVELITAIENAQSSYSHEVPGSSLEVGVHPAGINDEYNVNNDENVSKYSPSEDVTPLGDTVKIKTEDELESEVEEDDETNYYDEDNEMRTRDSGQDTTNLSIDSSDLKKKIDEIKKRGVRCKLCHLFCKSENGLKNHMIRTHPQEPLRLIKKRYRKRSDKPPPKPTEWKYKCTVENCGKSFVKHYLLRLHLAKHSQNPEFQCSFCPEAFYSRVDVQNHVRKAHTESIPPEKKQSHSYDICSKVCISSQGLSIHKRHAHKILPPKERPCPEEGCGMVFPRLALLTAHLSKCHGQQPTFKCTKCEKAFHTWKTRWMHEQMDHEEGRLRKQFICELCGKGFACGDYLNTHRYQTHRSTTSQGTKPTANKRHPFADPVNCDICGKSLKNSLTLRSHILQVHQKDKMKKPCHLCPKRFMSQRALDEHLFHTHFTGPEENRRKPKKGMCFQCPVTGCRTRVYGDKERLEKHMKKIHGEDRKKPGKYRCKFCGKDFFQSTKHKYHEMRHENKDTRPFICDICQKGYPTPDNLHFHRVHTHKIVGEDQRLWKQNKKTAVGTQEGVH